MDDSTGLDFRACFTALTGDPPFPWQVGLHARFMCGEFPPCAIPTGLGKTSVIAIWLIALAGAPPSDRFPRRLIYVVNRRTVVDQATREVEKIVRALDSDQGLGTLREALKRLGAREDVAPLSVSTLRGQFADNGEWRQDPARPAVIVGTVDMIGSRLLFCGFGCGFKSAPFHAGLIGQDALLVHDEAHLEPAFQAMIESVVVEQIRRGDLRPLRVMPLTATPRAGIEPFTIGPEDRAHEVVRARFEATKALALCEVEDEKKVVDELIGRAAAMGGRDRAILVFARSVEDVDKIAARLARSGPVQTLTGTMRGYERDRMVATSGVFARFLLPGKRADPPRAVPTPGTVWLVCTSAGEVGVNISADDLVCDLSPWESMAQRFGRVNRFGATAARVEVVFSATLTTTPQEKLSEFDRARARTLRLLLELTDVSPLALAGLDPAAVQTAFSPPPRIVQLTDIALDAWSMTTAYRDLPGRAPIGDWLHGVSEWQPPETWVAWREEVGVLATVRLDERNRPDDLLSDYPLKPHELLRDRSDRIAGKLIALSARDSECPFWLVSPNGMVTVGSLGELDDKKATAERIADCVVVLPPGIGGLEHGLLAEKAEVIEGQVYDVADEWGIVAGKHRRIRLWDDALPPSGMRCVVELDTRPDADEEDKEPSDEEDGVPGRFWRWFVQPRSADDDGSRNAKTTQSLSFHLARTEMYARSIVGALGLDSSDEGRAIVLAARAHDLGKHRALWQRGIRNAEYPARVLAKSGNRKPLRDLTGYRHELGSLSDVLLQADFGGHSEVVRELALHAIACHHGRARPHFPETEMFDPERPDSEVRALVLEVPRRFVHLARRYGRWGLAWLESLVRAADALASQDAEDAEL